MTAYLLGALVFLVGIIVFVMQNTAEVTVHFITWTSPQISLALVVLIAACAGALVTFLTDSFRAFKTGQKMKELLAQNKKLQREIDSFKGTKGSKSTKTSTQSQDAPENKEKK